MSNIPMRNPWAASADPHAPRSIAGSIYERMVGPDTYVPGISIKGRLMSPVAYQQQQTDLLNKYGAFASVSSDARQQLTGAGLKSRMMYNMGIRRSDDPLVQASLDSYATNPPGPSMLSTVGAIGGIAALLSLLSQGSSTTQQS